MKKYLVVLTLALFSNSLFAVNITAYLTHSAFNTPTNSPYIETYLSVIGNTIKFAKNANGKYQGAIDIAVAFKQNGEIKQAKKYTLNSPEIADTISGFPNFIDQQRYSLPNGSYEMEITIADKNQSINKPFSITEPININFLDDRITVSNIQLLESYTKSLSPSPLTKSGFDLVPYVSTFFPENSTRIKLYSEVYNAKKIAGEAQKIVINYFIESYESKIKLTDYSAFSKQTANDVNILLAELNIENLPSGNYNVVVEIRDKDNMIQADQRYFIQRKNKQAALSFEDLKSINVSNTFVSHYKSIDTLSDYIRSLRPISSLMEIQYSENQLQGKKLELMQQYFYNFWKSRNSLQPELTWLEYSKEVLKVNKEFGTFGLKGYDTDRGRVYLQYGAPNQRNKVDNEPSAYPYEIWQYDVLVDRAQELTSPNKRQSNRRFIFYNPDLVSNKYVVLHSDARGENYNIRWEIQLHKRDSQSRDIDAKDVPEHMGGNAEDNFLNPR
ncbi:MAG: GWxTD domain-containing protein [Bacteroidota bacterium]